MPPWPSDTISIKYDKYESSPGFRSLMSETELSCSIFLFAELVREIDPFKYVKVADPTPQFSGNAHCFQHILGANFPILQCSLVTLHNILLCWLLSLLSLLVALLLGPTRAQTIQVLWWRDKDLHLNMCPGILRHSDRNREHPLLQVE